MNDKENWRSIGMRGKGKGRKKKQEGDKIMDEGGKQGTGNRKGR